MKNLLLLFVCLFVVVAGFGQTQKNIRAKVIDFTPD